MDRKVRILRLWLLTAIVVAVGCWEPALWFGVPLFFFPTCACCGGAGHTCCGGGTPPDTMTVVFADFDTVGGSFTCANANGTWVLDKTSTTVTGEDISSFPPCYYEYTDSTTVLRNAVHGITIQLLAASSTTWNCDINHPDLGTWVNTASFGQTEDPHPDCSAFSSYQLTSFTAGVCSGTSPAPTAFVTSGG